MDTTVGAPGVVLMEATWILWGQVAGAILIGAVTIFYGVREVMQLVTRAIARRSWVLVPGVIVAEQVDPHPEHPRFVPIVTFADPGTGQTRQHTATEAYRGRAWTRGAPMPVRINPRDTSEVLCVDEGGRSLARRWGVLCAAVILLLISGGIGLGALLELLGN